MTPLCPGTCETQAEQLGGGRPVSRSWFLLGEGGETGPPVPAALFSRQQRFVVWVGSTLSVVFF